MMKQSAFTVQEQGLIQSFASLSDDLDLLSQRVVEAIKTQLGLTRNIEEIKSEITKIQNASQVQRNGPEESEKREQGQNLFKTFEDDSKNQLNLGLARPVPRRRNMLSFSSKRKVGRRQMQEVRSRWSLQQRLNELEEINDQCTYSYDKYDRKMSRKASFKQQNGINTNILWFYNEYFYPNYDSKYFEAHPMGQVYEELGLKAGEVSHRNHLDILMALPKPKVFNDRHLHAEKAKLEQFRNTCRQNTKNLSKSNEMGTEFPVHSVVLALHPMCGHLHTGSIMAYYKENLYMVRFHKPELPTHKILDINMSTAFISIPNKIMSRNEHGLDKEKNIANNEGRQGDVTGNINFQATAYLIKILEFKTEVLRLMRSINDKSDRKENVAPEKEGGDMNEVFEWCVRLVKRLDQAIQESIIVFRLRGLSEGNSSQVFGNLKNLLLNPLKLMSKQFENSNELSDINASQQIKQIINREREVLVSQLEGQIKKAINNAVQANRNGEEQKMENKMMPLICCCLRILADLKYEGKNFDVQSNLNLMKLADMSGKENSEAFNEVYERLFSIVTKVKQ